MPRVKHTLNERIEEYIADRLSGRVWTESSEKKLSSLIRRFGAHASQGGKDGEIDFLTVGRAHVLAWRESRTHASQDKKSPQSRNSANADLAAVKAFYAWCALMGYLSNHPFGNPTSGMKSQRTVQDPSYYRYPHHEWPALLDVAPRPRERALVGIALHSAARAQDIGVLRWGEVDPFLRGEADEIPMLRKKTVSSIPVPGSEELWQELTQWREEYSRNLLLQGLGPIQPEHFIIASYARSRAARLIDPSTGRYITVTRLMPEKSIEKELDEVAQRIIALSGVDPKKEGMHTFRRSAALAFLVELEEVEEEARQQGLASPLQMPPIEYVRALLGHAEVRTTWEYVGRSFATDRLRALVGGRRNMFRDRTPEADVAASNVRHLRAI